MPTNQDGSGRKTTNNGGGGGLVKVSRTSGKVGLRGDTGRQERSKESEE